MTFRLSGFSGSHSHIFKFTLYIFWKSCSSYVNNQSWVLKLPNFLFIFSTRQEILINMKIDKNSIMTIFSPYKRITKNMADSEFMIGCWNVMCSNKFIRCFHQFFSLSSWKRKQTCDWSRTFIFSVCMLKEKSENIP